MAAATTRARAGASRARARARGDQADEYTAAQEAADQTQPAPGVPPAPEPAEPAPPDPRPGPRARFGAGRRAYGGRVTRGERWFDASAREAGRISLAPPRRLTARDGSGFMFGLFLYVLALNYVRHGPEGVKGWLAAKFLNKPWTPPEDQPKAATGKAAKASPGGLRTTRPRPPKQVQV